MMTDARILSRVLTLAALACLLALTNWPEIPRPSRADVVRDMHAVN